MPKQIFSRTYDALTQRKFVEALEKEEYEEAGNYLEKMMHASTPSERIERTLVLFEGYRALAKQLLANQLLASDEEDSDGDDSGEELGKLEDYRRLGKPEEIERKIEELRKLEEIIRTLQ